MIFEFVLDTRDVFTAPHVLSLCPTLFNQEERLDVLVEKMKELNLNIDDYWWYLDLRRFGSVPHAGYGLGFERLVTYVCGIENIRDAIAFPRYPGNAEF